MPRPAVSLSLIVILGLIPGLCGLALKFQPSSSNTPSTTATYSTTPDRLLTATAIISQATAVVVNATLTRAAETGVPLTSTPIPTLSTGETEALRHRWLTELETTAGFSHPAFEQLTNSLVEDAVTAIAYQNENAYGNGDEVRRFLLQPEGQHVEYNGKSYVAVIARSDYVSLFPMPHTLLLFQISEGTPVLLPNPIEDHRYLFGLGLSFDMESEFPGGFGDRNANDVPDLLVYSSDFVGSSGCIDWGSPMLLEIQPDGSFADITPYSHSFPWLKPAGVLDLDHDGILEFRMRDDMGTPLRGDKCQVELVRYYGWNGEAYVDISPSLPETLWPGIQSFWRSIEDEEGCVLPSLEMYQVLLDHEARGQLEAGWERIQSALSWDRCSTEIIARNSRDMNNLTEWVDYRLDNYTD